MYRQSQETMVVAMLVTALFSLAARATDIHDYRLIDSFNLPIDADRPNDLGVYDILPDGRLVVVIGPGVYLEEGRGARTFTEIGSLPGGDFHDFGASFVRVSPDGQRVAIGNGGGVSFGTYQVGVFDLDDLTGAWLTANHFAGEWIDNTQLVLTGGVFGEPSFVSVLDTTSPDPGDPDISIIIDGIGGASGGVVLDREGRLFTGNGYAIGGPSGTGAVKAFARVDWNHALTTGVPLDFETDGTLVVDILSASPLGFDDGGNLAIGGGDTDISKIDFVALVGTDAITAALSGNGPIDIKDASLVRRIDPDTGNKFNFFGVRFNPNLRELYVHEGGTVFVYQGQPSAVPTASTAAAMGAAMMIVIAGFRRLRSRPN